jgi:hypothetical protein
VRHLTRAFGLLSLLVGCESDPEPKFEPECTLNAFRACLTDACRGVEQCAPPGVWSECACTVTDATFPEASPLDAAHDADATSIDADADADGSSVADAADGS